MEKQERVKLTIRINKDDDDIKRWFDRIEELGQSRAVWVGALLYAFKNDLELDTGNASTYSPRTSKSYEERKKSHGSAKDRKREFVYEVSLTNPEAVSTYKELIAERYFISKALKAMIRRGASENKPDIKRAKMVLLSDKESFKRPLAERKRERIDTSWKETSKRKEKNPMLEFIG